MLPSGGLDVSMTSELGDALLTIIKHDVAKETLESTARRRIEFFVLRAEAIIVRLAERQEEIRAEQATAQARRDAQATILSERIGVLEQRLPDLLAEQVGLVQQVTDLQRLLVQDRAEFERYRAATTLALELLSDEGTRMAERIVALEQARLGARFKRLGAYIVGTVRQLWR